MDRKKATTTLLYAKYEENKDWLLVLLSQLLAVFMNGVAKFLQTEGIYTVHPLQIIGLRMSLTILTIACYWAWRVVSSSRPPSEQNIAREERTSLQALLLVRGVAGAFGVIGFYCNLFDLSPPVGSHGAQLPGSGGSLRDHGNNFLTLSLVG
ncbi:uncharacterized protein N7482_006249 [Penicillium canariense]|uniref:EamA domain-containing protein n=1 Tax=Penicillium canariense TaxID=189055 RepID=A0A9W9LP82_9EURO|nr:uncharacterized protein N7482_006249 [Penicillium canariense]KAJ5167468.1 hypothetical protein N7482_006249 [Penicillium canariense]